MDSLNHLDLMYNVDRALSNHNDEKTLNDVSSSLNVFDKIISQLAISKKKKSLPLIKGFSEPLEAVYEVMIYEISPKGSVAL